jgi:hypothetical protein
VHSVEVVIVPEAIKSVEQFRIGQLITIFCDGNQALTTANAISVLCVPDSAADAQLDVFGRFSCNGLFIGSGVDSKSSFAAFGSEFNINFDQVYALGLVCVFNFAEVKSLFHKKILLDFWVSRR